MNTLMLILIDLIGKLNPKWEENRTKKVTIGYLIMICGFIDIIVIIKLLLNFNKTWEILF